MQKFTGKLVSKLPVTTYGKEGKKKGGFVIQTEGKYPKNVAFTVFEAKLASLDGLTINENVEVDAQVESREWQGKWFTDVIALNVFGVDDAKPMQEEFRVPDKVSDDLPF